MHRVPLRTLAAMASSTEAGVGTALKDVVRRMDAAKQRGNVQRQVRPAWLNRARMSADVARCTLLLCAMLQISTV